MISITTPTYDLNGSLLLPVVDNPGAESAGRRVSRTATLDGGASVTDGGFSDADRTIRVSVPSPSLEQLETARYLVKNYDTVQVSTRHGYYEAVPHRYAYDANTLSIVLLVTERLDD